MFRHRPTIVLGKTLLDLVVLGTTFCLAFLLWCEQHEWRATTSTGTSPIPTLLIGAGRAGAAVAKEIAARADLGILPVGFLDDDPGLSGMKVGGIPVLGTTSQLEEVARCHHVR